MEQAAQNEGGMTRRSFLTRAVMIGAAGVGVGFLLRKKISDKSATPAAHMDEDSIFLPRADQRDRVLGRK